MAVELPSELQSVLGLLGLNWPQADEDQLNELADQLKKLASAIDSTQLAADKALGRLAEVYHGASADRMASLWAGVTKYSGMVVSACETTAKALNAASVVIEICKGETITQLSSIEAQLAASAATFGTSTGAIIAAGKAVVSQLLEEALAKLGQALAQPIGDLVDAAVKQVIGSAPERSNGHGFGVEPAQVTACSAELRRHADDIDVFGNTFKRIVSGLHVGEPGDAFGKLVVDAAEHIAESVGTQILNRILGSFRDAATKMDLVVRNLTDNEDTHSQQLNGLMSGHSSTVQSPGLFQQAGTALDSAGLGGPALGLAGIAALRPNFDGVSAAAAHAPGGLGEQGGPELAGGAVAGAGAGLNVLGGVHGGSARHGAAPSAEPIAEGEDGQHAVPTNLGIISGGGQRGERGTVRKDLQTAQDHAGVEQSSVGRAGAPVSSQTGVFNAGAQYGATGAGNPAAMGMGGFGHPGAAGQQRGDRDRRSRRYLPTARFGEQAEGEAEESEE